MEKKKDKIDRRVYKTRKAIRAALARLLFEKDLTQITVAELSEEADIERKTFYTHYNGVYEVISELEDEMFCEFNEKMKSVNNDDLINNPYVIFEKLMLVINMDMDVYGNLLQLGEKTELMPKLKHIVIEKLTEALKEKYVLSEELSDLVTEFVVSGMFAVYTKWFESDRTTSIEDISEAIRVTCVNGIKGLLEKPRN